MKKRNILIGTLLLLGVIIVGFILFSNSNLIFKNDGKSAVHTPVRVGKGEGRAMLEATFEDFKSAVNNSDIVVDITITSWISEDKKDLCSTFFNAKVNTCLKGNSPVKIVLSHFGNSELTLKNYPLFDVGDRMIVFLKKSTDAGYDNAYYLIGEYTSIIDVKMIDNTLYTADRWGVLTEEITKNDPNNDSSNFTKVDADKKSEFLNQIYLYDTLKYKPEGMYKNFFLYIELVNEIKNIAIEGGN